MIWDRLPGTGIGRIIIFKLWLKGFVDDLINKMVSELTNFDDLPERSEQRVIIQSSDEESIRIELNIIREKKE